MKTLLRIVVSVLGVLVIVGLIAFADGATMPVDHVVSVTGTVAAPPTKVFALITDIGTGPTWRPQVKSVTVLPKDNGRDVWIEDYGSGQKMKFVALTTAPVGTNGTALRVNETKDPAYGGTWTYSLSPGPSPNTTTLTITEKGYINSPVYRFIMAHVVGPKKNLNDYMADIQAAAPKL